MATNRRRMKNCTTTTGTRGTTHNDGIKGQSAIASTKQKPSSHGGCSGNGSASQPQDSQSRFHGSCLSFERYAKCVVPKGRKDVRSTNLDRGDDRQRNGGSQPHDASEQHRSGSRGSQRRLSVYPRDPETTANTSCPYISLGS